MTWRLVYTRQAQQDARRLDAANLRPDAEQLLNLLARDPFETPPPFVRLLGDLGGSCSRRISFQHRLVYQVVEDARAVKVLRMWTHLG